jgi:cob(I)alamin adenosyltransferase
MQKALVYLWTGNGAGKTTSALGTALRAVGHKQKVIIIQFMKGRKDIGEYLIKDRLIPNYEIYQFGRKEFVDLKKPNEKDKKLAADALAFAKNIARMKKPNLLILDEVNLAAAIGLVDVNEVIRVLDAISPPTAIYMTGRSAPKKLIDRADFATEIKEIKRPKQKIPAKKGIEY